MRKGEGEGKDMKRLLAGLLASACVGALTLALRAAPAPAATGALRGLAWTKQLGPAAGDEVAQALAWSAADGCLLVAGFALADEEAGRPGGFWLRRLDASGEVRQETALPSKRGQAPVARGRRYIGGVAALPDGGALVVVELGQARPVLMRVDVRGQVLFSRALAEHSTSVARLVPAEQGRYLIVGSQGDDAFAAKLDGDGRAVWTRTFDRGEHEGFEDVLPTENGGFLAVGVARGDDPAGGERVWVVRANAEGLRQADLVFAGRAPAVARAADGSHRVVYDSQSDGFAHDAWIVSLDVALKATAKQRLLDKDAGFPVRLGIVAHPRGGFLVGGAKGLGLWLQHVDAQERPSWSWSDSPMKGPEGGETRAWHQWLEGFAASGDAVFALSSLQRVEPGTSSTKAGLLKLGEP